MPKHRKTIENGEIYSGHVPYAAGSNKNKVAQVDTNGNWTFGEGGGSGSGLPDVDSGDNGKLLGVTEGAWGVVSAPTDTVICNFTYDSVNDTYTCDKTVSELMTAFNAGKNVIGFVPSPVAGYGTYKVDMVNSVEGGVSFSITYVSDAGEDYIELAYFSLFGSVVENADSWYYFNDVRTLNDTPSATLNNGILTIG